MEAAPPWLHDRRRMCSAHGRTRRSCLASLSPPTKYGACSDREVPVGGGPNPTSVQAHHRSWRARGARVAPSTEVAGLATVLYFRTPPLNGRHVYGRVS